MDNPGDSPEEHDASAHLIPTERLDLRPWTRREVAAVLAGHRAPHWAADYPADGDTVIAGYIAEHPEALGMFGQRQIVERKTGLVVGGIGLFWPPQDGSVEFGYGVVPSREGRGYASEAARAIVAFAFTAPRVHVVQAVVERSNPASARVLEKAGMRRSAEDRETITFALRGMPADAPGDRK
jgi:RimJ/RimL family protein N-acetyltransferase